MSGEFNLDFDVLAKEITQEVIKAITPLLPSNGSEDTLLTPNDLSDLLQIKKAQVYAWVEKSKYEDNGLPYMKAGKFLRFSKREVLEWMKNRKEVR